MFGSKKHILRGALFLTDNEIRYIVLQQKGNKFEIIDHGAHALDDGVIHRGEVISPDILLQILRAIKQKTGIVSVDILLPHELFEHTKVILSKIHKSRSRQNTLLKKQLQQDLGRHVWANTHAYEAWYEYHKGDSYAHIQLIQQDHFRAINHLVKKAGLVLEAIHSDDFSIRHQLGDSMQTLVLRVGYTGLAAHYFDGMQHQKDLSLELGYHQLLEIIEKYGLVDRELARKALQKHGVLPLHPDPKVYQNISRVLKEVLVGLSRQKNTYTQVLMWFDDFEIPGLHDTFAKSLRAPVGVIDIAKHKDQITNLSLIHRDELPGYTSLFLYLLG